MASTSPSSKPTVPLFYPFIPKEAVQAVAEVLRSRYVGEGQRVAEFEANLGIRLDNRQVVSLNNGTSALFLALDIAGVGPGDEVVTPAHTSQATNMPILQRGARPVFADVKYESCTLDPVNIEKRLTPRTKAILCVDWGGYPSDLDEIRKVGKEHGLPVIEDAAHALGASYKGKKVGSICDYTAFSFQAIKHITTGDGGALSFLDDNQFAKAVRRKWYGIDRSKRKFSYLGIDPDFDITEIGYKIHMNDIAAAIGLTQLNHLAEIVTRRTFIAKRYREELEGLEGIELMENRDDRQSSNWLFSLHVKKRLSFAKAMWDSGIEVSVVNWRNDKYTVFGGLRQDLPNTDKLYQDYLAIPMHNKLSDDDVERVIAAVKSATRQIG
ncbi:MAG: DegT/DnrJ/EryC1/StrS family aminotransferase [Nitrososphaerota archaeon]|nr:DegT/DnrJ/EryC1/StrS family aminotransferase [Nitrososphaerota archaeon]